MNNMHYPPVILGPEHGIDLSVKNEYKKYYAWYPIQTTSRKWVWLKPYYIKMQPNVVHQYSGIGYMWHPTYIYMNEAEYIADRMLE